MSSSYEVVTICGSMTLFDDMLKVAAEEEANGRLVFAPFPVDIPNEGRIAFLQMLDELHRRKIDLSDSIIVVTHGGRIGKSTRGEIAYAIEHGKAVRYAESSMSTSKAAAERVRAFLDARAAMSGLDPNLIAQVANRVSDHEIVSLTVEDLRALSDLGGAA